MLRLRAGLAILSIAIIAAAVPLNAASAEPKKGGPAGHGGGGGPGGGGHVGGPGGGGHVGGPGGGGHVGGGHISGGFGGGGHGGPALRPAPAPRPAATLRSAPAAHPQPHAISRAAPAMRHAMSPRDHAPRIAAPQRGPAATMRAQRHELRGAERRHAMQPNTAVGRAAERRELQRNAAQGRLEQLQQQSSRGHMRRDERRELRRLERAQRQQPENPQAAARPTHQRTARAQRLTPQQATAGRFASRFMTGESRREDRRAARLAAQSAWRQGLRAAYVPWRGPVYWPYAYNDIFYSTFWPDAYDPGYWAYAYDDFYDGIFFPDGAPLIATAWQGPYAEARETTGSAHARPTATPGRLSESTREFCAEQAKGVEAWPFEQIERAVQPTGSQDKLLANLKKAAARAGEQFRDACPDAVPLTPPGRLQAMTMRLQATSDAIKTIRPALLAFYDSLSDEQKARFNEIGPELKQTARAAQGREANCNGEKAGISALAIERIDAVVQPTDAQEAALDRLDDAIQKSVGMLARTCPEALASTPVGRLDAMQKRLQAMIAAANTVRPALEDFYASLNDEQKSRFNRLGRQTAQAGH